MASADHLAVLVHGFWGNPSHLKHLQDTLQKRHSADRLHILVAKSNSNNHTYDGIEVGGERIANEVEEKIAELEKNGTTIKKISITGYSLGGLISRYAIGLMFNSGLFDRIQPMNFSTFASPHIGIRAHKGGIRSELWNYMGARVLSTSGQQMFLIDTFRDTGKPLLSIMADPDKAFIKGLRMFKHKWVYANTLNDRSVPFYTALFSRTDPFVALDKIQVHYLKDQPVPGEVILDPSNYVSPRLSKPEDSSLYNRFQLIDRKTFSNLPFYMFIIVAIPLALPVFMINSGYQTYQSAQRIRHHESGGAFSLDRYRAKLLEQAQAVQDRTYERVATSQAEDYLPTPPPESTRESSRSSSEDTKDVELARRESSKKETDFPLLALTKEQFEMIDVLDSVGFVKYPVHIQKHRHTHAAIVVRINKASFDEGKVISEHWAGKFEI
ncbi:lipase/serine esterase like protein [Zymoseptoria brevis]|uniref:Lipase/serine esterase like protein n=1 Tax=Zymoseptoria brevis TaxID=1047168 RepID=A0A0F4GK57_9PEZI|nr:lipase/serine esterase like protein [Zymoseptoria brevis]